MELLGHKSVNGAPAPDDALFFTTAVPLRLADYALRREDLG
jgi:hypothetical protein